MRPVRECLDRSRRGCGWRLAARRRECSTDGIAGRGRAVAAALVANRGGGEVERRGGFTNAAFLIENGNAHDSL